MVRKHGMNCKKGQCERRRVITFKNNTGDCKQSKGIKGYVGEEHHDRGGEGNVVKVYWVKACITGAKSNLATKGGERSKCILGESMHNGYKMEHYDKGGGERSKCILG